MKCPLCDWDTDGPDDKDTSKLTEFFKALHRLAEHLCKYHQASGFGYQGSFQKCCCGARP